MSRRAVILLVVGLLVAATATFLVLRDSDEGAIDVSLEQPTATPDVADSDDAPLRIAVAAMTSPKETFVHYEELLDYIGAKLGREVDLVQRESYEEVNDLLEVGELDLAFVCTGAYVEGHDAFDMQIVAAPVAYGEPVYYSYLIVGDDSGAGALEDLRGTRFAICDPLSNTGHHVPVDRMGKLGETPASNLLTFAAEFGRQLNAGHG